MVGMSGFDRRSLDGVPHDRRLSLLREVVGPSLNMDLEPLTPNPVFDIGLSLLPGVTVMEVRHSPFRVARADLSHENDDLMFGWSAGGRGRMRSRGREVVDGASVMWNCADPFAFELHNDSDSIAIRVARPLIAALLPRVDDACMQPLSPDHSPLRLLHRYIDLVRRDTMPRSPEFATAIAAHICDLIALSVGVARQDGATRGVRAARLAAIKRWVLAQLHEPSLSVAAAAATEKVSARYVQMLFEAEGTTFSSFVLQERLARVHRLLSNPMSSHAPISTIAFDAGFGDLSYFNRAFRAAYGETPSDVRHRATRHQG